MSPPFSVAVVGAGPAGLYTIGHLLEQTDADINIDLYERLPNPWGLIRSGVAPDHPEKKRIADCLFSYYLHRPQVRYFGNVEIGVDVSHAELCRSYDAVIYATGAGGDVRLGIPGEDLPGSASAREFVGWYNGHPDFAGLSFSLSGERAVIVGNGNVALDVARVLTSPPDILARTDIADYALAALQNSKIKEVIILGRRGILQSSFHNPELEELESIPDLSVDIEGDVIPKIPKSGSGIDWNTRRKVQTLDLLSRRGRRGTKRIVFQFLASPAEISGDGKVENLRIVENKIQSLSQGRPVACATGRETMLEAGLILRAVGYRGKPFPRLPFNGDNGAIRNEFGRVRTRDASMPGVYVTGWAKRGPQGLIGTNKSCSAETVRNLLEDRRRGILVPPSVDRNYLINNLQRGGRTLVLRDGWQRINQRELADGTAVQRPRIKRTVIADMLRIAESSSV